MTQTRRLLFGLALAGLTRPAAARVNHAGGVAVHGVDVVSYRTDGGPRGGSAAFGRVHGGAEWHFASEVHRARFTAAPDAFLPRFGGFCAFGVAEGYLVDVDPAAWDIVDGRLYLNFSLAVRRRWRRDIAGNIRRAEANWPRLMAG
ncbi:MAG: YHS domain protein [Acetobacteraceae bacterium]|nr:YHS domain protein [Acetobacteraceae bacterium]